MLSKLPAESAGGRFRGRRLVLRAFLGAAVPLVPVDASEMLSKLRILKANLDKSDLEVGIVERIPNSEFQIPNSHGAAAGTSVTTVDRSFGKYFLNTSCSICGVTASIR